eukprot:scaffold204_cov135-Skeletonema_menzelii.AAC.2
MRLIKMPFPKSPPVHLAWMVALFHPKYIQGVEYLIIQQKKLQRQKSVVRAKVLPACPISARSPES